MVELKLKTKCYNKKLGVGIKVMLTSFEIAQERPTICILLPDFPQESIILLSWILYTAKVLRSGIGLMMVFVTMAPSPILDLGAAGANLVTTVETECQIKAPRHH